MPKEIIEKFINDNIKLVTDRPDIAQSQAGTESESSKDYTGRVIFEFFQNAIDKAESNIWLEVKNDKFIISNDGIAFSIEEKSTEKYKKSDFHALNTIHNSNKKAGESVGNKGVGFKSCWNVSNHVTIESIKDNKAWGFELFNPVTAENFKDNNQITKVINSIGIGAIPSFYFPKYIDSNNDEFKNGEKTKVTINLRDKNAEEEINKEITNFEETKFFFLNLLKNKQDKNLTIHINNRSISSKDETWQIINLKSMDMFEKELCELKEKRKEETYANIPDEPNIAIAFPPDFKDEIDSKFYTYLPTKVKCGFNVLIHADFALDNARVSIPDNEYNNKILEIAAKMLVNELLTNEKFHTYEYFAKFIIPNKEENSSKKFNECVWHELINNNLTEILKKVFTKEKIFPRESYGLIFDAMTKLTIHRGYGEGKEGYYNKVYEDTIKYFCDENIYIVYINDKYVASLPTKEKDEDNQKNKLFYIDEEKNESQYDFSLLQSLKNITLSSMSELNRDIFIKNNIVKENRNIEIYRAIAIEMEKNENLTDENKLAILKFLSINAIDSFNIDYFESDEAKRRSKAGVQLARIKLPTKNNGWQPANRCFFNISEEVAKIFQGFYEVEYNQLEKIFPNINDLKCFGAWYTIPITDDFSLPWLDDKTPQIKDKEFKELLQKSIAVWKKIEEISKDKIQNMFDKIKKQKIFFDEINDGFCSPNEVFLFNDERKRKGIYQAKKEDCFRELYEFFSIFSIEDTKEQDKILSQLKKMKDIHIDKEHKTIYKQLILSLSKIKNIDLPAIPLLINNEYIDNQEDIWFADRNTKRYKHYFEKLHFVEFDIETNKEFINKVGVKEFAPGFKLMPVDAISKHQSNLKQEIESKYLSDMFCLAEEAMNVNRFDKEEAIVRWNNLQIGYATDVWIELTLNDEHAYTIGKDKKNDVLFKPLSDSQRQQSKGGIGELIHDLEGNAPQEIIANPKFSDFGYAIADGVFRDALLGPILSAYLKDKNNFLKDKGIEQSEINEMKSFIEKSLLSDEDKSSIVEVFKKQGLEINLFPELRDFDKYHKITSNFQTLLYAFDDKFKSIVENIISEYRSFHKQKLLKEIETQNSDSKIEIVCFKQKSKKEYFHIQKEKIINKKIEDFKTDFNIFSLFEINELEGDEFINAKLDFEFGIDIIKNCKLNISSSKKIVQTQSNPSLGDAKEAKKDSNHKEENEKRGIGQELKIAYNISKDLSDEKKKEFIESIQKTIYEKDDGLKEKENIKNYLEALNNYQNYNDLEFAQKVIQIASNKLDGLGYDLLVPEFENDKLSKILKVELKTTVRESNIEIHLSKNELDRILYFMENKVENWQIWLNNRNNDITAIVKEEVEKFNKQESSFYAKDYILTMNTAS
jgi:hypothetical protein